MKKKEVVLLGCMIGLLTLNGCGNTKTVETDVIVTSEEVVTQTESAGMETETTDVSQTTVESEAEESRLPQVVIENHEKTWKAEDGETVLFTLQYDSVKLANDTFAELAESLFNDFPEDRNISAESEELEWAKSDYEYAMSENGSGYFYGYDSTEKVSVERCDERILSLTENYSGYTGGAHGYYGTTGYNYDVKSGAKLSISDLLEKEDEFYKEASLYICNELKQEYGEGLFPEYQETVETAWNSEYPVNWYLNGTGIVVVYNPYEVGPYAMGQAQVTLPYAEFSQYIKEEFQMGKLTGVSAVSANIDLSNVVGAQQPIMLKRETLDADYYEYEYAIQSGEQEVALGQFNSYYYAFLLRREDARSFLFVSLDYASDDYVSYVFEVTDGNIQKCEELGNTCFLGNGFTQNEVSGEIHVDMLGTYGAKMQYAILEDGSLEEVTEMCPVASYFEMTVTKDLPVTIEGKETTLPVGSKLSITGTNLVDTVTFETSDGITGSIQLTPDEESFGWLIQGVSENEYFEMVPYAG